MKDSPHDPNNPWSRSRGKDSVAKRTNTDLGPLGFGRNLVSDSPPHLYRSAHLSIGGGPAADDRYRVGWFYAYANRTTYQHDKFGHWSFSVHLRLGRFTLGVNPSWAIGTR